MREELFSRDRAPHTSDRSPLKLAGMLAVTASSLFVVTPLALAFKILSLPLRLVSSPSANANSGGFRYAPVPKSPLAAQLKPFAQREFDLVVFGATGFTGRLACKYLARQYGTRVKFAIAGRRVQELEAIKKELVAMDPALAGLVVIKAESGDEASLHAMCARARVVLSTAGPFQLYSTNVVRCCIANSTSYCDITGEIDWVQDLIKYYDEDAKKAGARIVNFCGHDCVPWDLVTLALSKKLGGEEMKEVEMIDVVEARPSGGTLKTVEVSVAEILMKPFGMSTRTAPPDVVKGRSLGFNPLLLSSDSKTKSEYDLIPRIAMGPRKTFDGNYGTFFVMAGVNSQVVRRSNALNGYGKRVVYREAAMGPSLIQVLTRTIMLGNLLPVFLLPDAIKYKLIPAPGEGPSEYDMHHRCFLEVIGRATGVKGTVVQAHLYIEKDPGYLETAKMLVESGLCIALSPERMKCEGGVKTPASCQGEVLLERLLNTEGIKFKYASNL